MTRIRALLYLFIFTSFNVGLFLLLLDTFGFNCGSKWRGVGQTNGKLGWLAHTKFLSGANRDIRVTLLMVNWTYG